METPVTLVLLPGLDGTEVFFGPLISALPPWIRAQVVPYPAQRAAGNSYAELQARVEAAVSGLDECFVFAWSFGGPLALRLACARPELVRGVILCASFVRPPRPALARWRWAVVTPVIWTLRALWRTRLLFRRFGSPTFRRAKGETWRRVDASALAARAVDARVDLATCKAPILCIQFARDRSVPPHNARQIQAGAPRAELLALEGHHLGMFEGAEAVAAAVARFVRSARPAEQQRLARAHGLELAGELLRAARPGVAQRLAPAGGRVQ